MKIVPQQSRIVVAPIQTGDNEIEVPDGRDEDGGKKVYKRMRVTAVGTPRLLNDGREIPIPLQVGDEVVIDFRAAVCLEPGMWYGGEDHFVVDYAYCVAKIEREPNEPICTPGKESKIIHADASILAELK